MTASQGPQQHTNDESHRRAHDEQAVVLSQAEPRRMLVINDFPFPDVRFTSNGIDVEMTRAQDIDSAIKQLDDWKKQGRFADIVTVDCHQPDPIRPGMAVDVAADYLARIQMWKESTDAELHPKKLFLHSFGVGPSLKATLSAPAEIDFHSASDLLAIVDFAENRPVSIHYGSGRQLRHYINAMWGTEIPETREAAGKLAIERNMFDVATACEAVQEFCVKPFQAVLGIVPTSLTINSALNTTSVPDSCIRFGASCGGAAVGGVAFDEQDIKELQKVGKKVVLVVEKLSPDHLLLVSDLVGMVVLEGDTLTQHCPVILNAHNVAGVFGVEDDAIGITTSSDGTKHFQCRHGQSEQMEQISLSVGDLVSIGDAKLYPIALPLQSDLLTHDEEKLARWSRELHAMYGGPVVMANADTPVQVVNAIQHGAVGIGLVRTEHMFFTQEGLDVLRSLLLAPANETVLHNFEVYQQQQFKELLVAAKGADIPVTIRLLDAPPEEFLNQEQLHEFKSNLGGQCLRGLPFALKAPGVYRAQLRALFEALRDSRFDGELKVMIPLVYNAGDLARIKSEYSAILQEYGDTIDQERIRFGSMIETLGAIQTAGPIAKICDFVSFGTKDLTREIVGIPRNDVAGIDTWMRENETAISPYQSLCEPVREAIETALAEINSVDTEISMCGEHVSGDFESIKFCHKFSFNCISVNPTGRVIKMSQIMLGKLRASDLKAEELEWCVSDYQVPMLHDNLKAMRAINPNCANRRLPVNASLVSKFISTAASLLGLPSESLEAHGSETRRRLIQDVVMHVLSELPLKTRAMLIADVYDLGLRISREGRAQGELRSDKTDGWWHETIQSLFRIYLVFQRLLSKAPPEGVQLADILSGLQELREKFREYLSNPPEGILESSLASLEDLTTQIALILGDDVFSE